MEQSLNVLNDKENLLHEQEFVSTDTSTSKTIKSIKRY